MLPNKLTKDINMTKKQNIKTIRSIPPVPKREAAGHKGSYGTVLVLGGSVGMSGAPSLAGMAALRGGAGLVQIAVPEAIQSTVAGLVPCATTIGLPTNTDGQIDPLGAKKLLNRLKLFSDKAPDALVVGPGFGLSTKSYGRWVWELIDAFRTKAHCPAVIDADALNLAGSVKNGHWSQGPQPNTIITPHPGEMARLHAVSPKKVQADRRGFALKTAEILNRDNDKDALAVVVLKGAGTIVTDGQKLYVNKTGNPGMATGGTGDVLSGLLGALLAQGLPPFDAAVLGTYLHGLAGDLATATFGQHSLIATDLIDHIPDAFLQYGKK